MTSVQLYSVRRQFAADPADTLRRLAEIGFTQVEPFGLVENVATLRTGLPEHGLAAPTAHARLIDDDLDTVFAVARDCGVGVVIHPATPPEKWRDAEGVFWDGGRRPGPKRRVGLSLIGVRHPGVF